MTTYTAQELIAHAKAYMAAEAAVMAKRPAGYTRSAWRAEHPTGLPTSFHVKEGRAERRLWFDTTGNPYDLWVWAGTKLKERIDLRAPDADERLAKYRKN